MQNTRDELRRSAGKQSPCYSCALVACSDSGYAKHAAFSTDFFDFRKLSLIFNFGLSLKSITYQGMTRENEHSNVTNADSVIIMTLRGHRSVEIKLKL